jgi:2-dehydro-3-deoxyphosphooctonate aldolase (KDO 8-P synthase)
MQSISLRNVNIGPGHPLAIIAGPCVAESMDLCMSVAERIKRHCDKLGLSYIFKASFDKANRSSGSSPRGLGIDGTLKIFERVQHELGLPVTTDIHEPSHAAAVAGVVDLLQIPAFLCRQTDLLVAAAATGRAVNVKKGQFLSPAEMTNVVKKLVEGYVPRAGHGLSDKPQLMLTERGTFFGYNRLVNDFVGVGDMMDLGWPVCFDVTHSTQQPGGQGTSSGGRPERAPLLARAAVAAGVQSLFLETHPDPRNALSDAATMLSLEQAESLLNDAAALRKAVDAL